ncbi:MAG: glycoside hydrolase family 9 protein [Cytophagales bacterium]
MTKKFITKSLIKLSLLAGSVSAVWGQTPYFTSTEYKKALWMTTRMYGGQRSGLNNWLLNNHLPSGLAESYRGTAFYQDKDTDGYDLSGGWHDCGDHVKFGQTEFYSAYMLLKGFAEFPTGYDDRYAYDYAGYVAKGDWSFEGTGHAPNGIPDILDEVKHATDYFIKCTRSSSVFYYQVGQGDPDHAQWVTATKMQTLSVSNGGQTRAVYKNPNDASMPSFCGAALALMSRLYKKYDPTYAATCLVHAKYAYDYAKAHPGVAGTGDGGFYSANDNWKDDYATMCAELFWATGTASYKTEAQSYTFSAAAGQGKDIYGKAYGFDYSNNGDIAIYNLAKLGTSGAATAFRTLVTNFYLNSTQSDGQFNGGNTGWGPLRYNASAAFMVALDAKLNGNQTNTLKFVYDNIDYIFGKNSSSRSFVVGFGSNYPKHPHHRNVYLNDNNPGDAAKATMSIPTKNVQFGYMCGGTRTASSFSDDVVNYQHTEGGIDYNACLVGILGYINSLQSPVDTNKFGANHPVPSLGADQSLCGVTSITLKANVATDGKKTFTWLNGTTVLVNASTTQNTYTVTSAGTYTCRIDSASKWQTEDAVVISATLPTPNLGADKVICDTTIYTLNAKVSGTNYTYSWRYAADGTTASLITISGQTAQTLANVRNTGLYRVTLSATGCTSTTDDVVVTSKLPTAVDGCRKTAGTVDLSITNATGTSYAWYSAATGGTALGAGISFTTPSISSTTTYYVASTGTVNTNVGPTTALGSGNNWGVSSTNHLSFTALSNFQILSMDIPCDIYTAGSGTVTVEILDGSGNAFSPAKTFISDAKSLTVGNGQMITFSFTNFNILSSWGSSLRMRVSGFSGSGSPLWSAGPATYPYTVSNVVSITGKSGGNGTATEYMYFYNWKISTGSSCSRLPVIASIDSGCTTDSQDSQEIHTNNDSYIYPNPSNGVFNVEFNKSVTSASVYDGLGNELMKISDLGNSKLNLEKYPSGVYFLKTVSNTKSQVVKLIKE